jgi:hypothetical protein
MITPIHHRLAAPLHEVCEHAIIPLPHGQFPHEVTNALSIGSPLSILDCPQALRHLIASSGCPHIVDLAPVGEYLLDIVRKGPLVLLIVRASVEASQQRSELISGHSVTDSCY